MSFYFFRPPPLPTHTLTLHHHRHPQAATLSRDVSHTLMNTPRPPSDLHNEFDQGEWESRLTKDPTGQSKNSNIWVECKGWDI